MNPAWGAVGVSAFAIGATTWISLRSLSQQEKTTTAQIASEAERELEGRRQARIQDAYLELTRFIGRQASIIAWWQRYGPPTSANPLPFELAGPEQTLNATTGVVIFGAPTVRDLAAKWIAVHGVVTAAQTAGDTTRAGAELGKLLDLNDALVEAMHQDLHGGPPLAKELTEPPTLAPPG
jgi:hypothetical protein